MCIGVLNIQAFAPRRRIQLDIGAHENKQFQTVIDPLFLDIGLVKEQLPDHVAWQPRQNREVNA